MIHHRQNSDIKCVPKISRLLKFLQSQTFQFWKRLFYPFLDSIAFFEMLQSSVIDIFPRESSSLFYHDAFQREFLFERNNFFSFFLFSFTSANLSDEKNVRQKKSRVIFLVIKTRLLFISLFFKERK